MMMMIMTMIYCREVDKLQLDVGPFAAALEFASERKSQVCGKPDPSFFQAGTTEQIGIFLNFFSGNLEREGFN